MVQDVKNKKAEPRTPRFLVKHQILQFGLKGKIGAVGTVTSKIFHKWY
jgi:hypothetical protein